MAGVRVIELSHLIMGPSCGMFLSFLGAEVIKVEPPHGDKTRQLKGMGRPMFPLFNRGKKSVCLDLESSHGQDALHRLLATADVLVENFRDVSLTRMGIDPAGLRARYPSLIVASHKGFLHGPYENRTALDEVVQMMSGLAYMTGPSGRPLRVGASINDIMGGLFGTMAVLAALRERDQTGHGRDVRVGLFENSLMLVAQHMVQFELEGQNPPPMPEREFSWPVYDIFDTADAKQLFVAAVSDTHWHDLMKMLDLASLASDPHLSDRQQRIDGREQTLPILRQAIVQRTASSLTGEFESLGIPFSPIAKPGDLFDDPHVLRAGGLLTSTMPDGQHFRAPGMPLEIDGQCIEKNADVPGLGNHSDDILGQLGLSAQAIRLARGQPA